MHPISSNSPGDAMNPDALQEVARRYREEGYAVIPHPRGDDVPPFADGFPLDLVATRGEEGVVVVVKTNRVDLASDPRVMSLANAIDERPGWRMDLVVLGGVTAIERAAQDASEPSDEQLAEILKTADAMADNGASAYASVVAWSGLEAAIRRVSERGKGSARMSPKELLRALYSDGILGREQFQRLREADEIRTQVVHGLVPTPVDPALVRHVTAAARYLVDLGGVAMPASLQDSRA